MKLRRIEFKRGPARRIGIATLACTLLITGLSGAGVVTPASAGGGSKNPADWATWFLTSADQFRLPAPPAENSQTTKDELKELVDLQNNRTKDQKDAIKFWNDRPATAPWTEITLGYIEDFRPRPPFSARLLGYLHTAMYDAMVAAYDSKRAYKGDTRPAPVVLKPKLDPLAGKKKGSTYGNVQAAVAGAAETVLTQLAAEGGSLSGLSAAEVTALADEAVESRLWAGANYRSDVESARMLGQEVGALVVEAMKVDGSTNTAVTYPRPPAGEERAIPSNDGVVENQWQPTPPSFSTNIGGPVGTWTPWLMSDGDALRSTIPPPSTYGSPEYMDQLNLVIDTETNLTDEQERIAFEWDDGPGTFTPAGHWFDIMLDLVDTYGFNTKETARASALLGAVEADAAIAFFDAKYYWWSIRPITAIWRLCEGGTVLYSQADTEAASDATCPYFDNSLLPPSDPNFRPAVGTEWYSIIETPAFPSYPGGHGTFSGGASQILAFLFPASEDTTIELGEEAANSRLYGGIHYDEDNQQALVLGRAVGDLAIEFAENDGSNL